MNNPKKLWSTRTSAAQIPIKSQHFVSQNTIYQRTIWETYSSSKGAQLMLYWHDSLYFDTVDHTCTISVARDSAPVISNNLETYHNSDFVTNSYGESWDSSCEKSWVPVQKQQFQVPGADPGFFLGGGALVSCSTSTPINHIVFFGRIPVVLENRRSSRGGGGVGTPCTLPLDLPLSPCSKNQRFLNWKCLGLYVSRQLLKTDYKTL